MAKPPLNPINSVLNKVVSNLGLDRRLREHTFMSLWPTFVNSAIAERSRPLFIDADRNLVITVANAAVGQELSMLKGRLSGKITAAARALSIEVRGLRLDLKHYHQRSTMAEIPEAPALPKPSEADLAAVQLGASEIWQISALAEDLSVDGSCDEPTRQRILRLFERELRLRRWRQSHSFPVCPQCDNPVERLHDPGLTTGGRRQGEAVCITCLYGQP